MVDVLIVNRDGAVQLFKNRGATQGSELNWLTLELEGSNSNRDGVGAKIAVTADGTTRWRQVRAGTSYGAGDMLAANFGLGESETAERVEIYWPSSVYQSFKNVVANQWLPITEKQPRYQRRQPLKLDNRYLCAFRFPGR
ncbi:MAG: ASPIC/UnbV domain-containing protein [Chromatiaceae bacterium]|nr:ASPIC/UnbV domain-containing protein [Chromatiaceae bacterium]